MESTFKSAQAFVNAVVCVIAILLIAAALLLAGTIEIIVETDGDLMDRVPGYVLIGTGVILAAIAFCVAPRRARAPRTNEEPLLATGV